MGLGGMRLRLIAGFASLLLVLGWWLWPSRGEVAEGYLGARPESRATTSTPVPGQRVLLAHADEVAQRWGHFGPQSRPLAFAQGLKGLVLDCALHPLRDAAVWLVPATGATFARGITAARAGVSERLPIVCASTDARGRFTLGVPYPTGELVLDAQGFEVWVLADGHSDRQLPSVRVLPGTWRDLGTIRMAEGFAVVGTVTRRGAHTPVADAEVSLRPYARRNQASFVPGRESGTTVRTDAAGQYRISGVAIGATCDLGAAAPGLARSERLAIHLTRHGENRFDFELTEGGEITGRVTDTRGDLVPAARIVAVPVAGEPSALLEAWSDAAGRFALVGVPIGEHKLKISHTAFAPAEATAVGPGTRDLALVLHRLPAVRVQALDERGAILTAFSVRVRTATADPNALEGTAEPLHEVRAAADGFVELTELVPGQQACVLEVQSQGNAPAFSEPLALALDAPVQVVRVQLEAGGVIAGQVLGKNREPVVGVAVTTLPAAAGDDPFSWRTVTRLPTKVTERRAKTDAQGRFRLECLHPGRYVVAFAHEGHCDLTCEGIVVHRGETTSLGDTHLREGTLLSGTVRYLGRAPLYAKVTVSTLAEAGQHSGASVHGESMVGADGRFAIPRRLPPGRYRVCAGQVPRPEPFLPLTGTAITFAELTVDGTRSQCNVDLEVRTR